MSVEIMRLVFRAKLKDLDYEKNGEKRKAKASTVKLLLLAYADHANDDGESCYPGYTLLEIKTSLSRQGIADTLEAVTQNGLLTLVGKSRRETNNYQFNIEKLVKSLDSVQNELVKPLDQSESSGLTSSSQATRLESSLTIPKPSAAEKTRRTAVTKKGDLIDGMTAFAQSSGMAKSNLKDDILSTFEVRLRYSLTGRDAETFVDFIAKEKEAGRHYSKFIDWWIANGGQRQYWTIAKMRQNWLAAFGDVQPEQATIREPEPEIIPAAPPASIRERIKAL